MNLPGREPAEVDLSFPRYKPRSLAVSVSYRLVRIAKVVVGRRKVLSTLLQMERWLRRFAYETSVEVLGAPWLDRSLGLRNADLEAWLSPREAVIDIGCGLGRWSRAAARHASTVVGIDYDAASIAIARQTTAETNVTYRVGDALRDLDSGQFDTALLIHVLEHISDPVSLLHEVGGLARHVIVEVPNFEADVLNYSRLELGLQFAIDADHVREYTPNLLREHLARAGWLIDELFARGGSIVARASIRTIRG